jgi:hypothetical protein
MTQALYGARPWTLFRDGSAFELVTSHRIAVMTPTSGSTPASEGGSAPNPSNGPRIARDDELAFAAFAIGLIGLPASIVCLGVILGPIATLMGLISVWRIRRSDGTLVGESTAIQGMLLGAIAAMASLAFYFWIAQQPSPPCHNCELP